MFKDKPCTTCKFLGTCASDMKAAVNARQYNARTGNDCWTSFVDAQKLYNLKPCPFCGGEVRLDKAYSYFRDTVIYCDGCDSVFTLDDCNTTPEEIVNAWNRRTGDG